MMLESGASANSILAMIELGLREIGYTEGLLQRDYTFADLLTTSDAIRTMPLATFAQEPLSYRSACFGVLTSYPGMNVTSYRALGAPQLLEIHDQEIRRWKVMASGPPEILERIAPDEILTTIRKHRADWGPEAILRAKSIAFDFTPVQLDFFDANLLPAIEAVVHTKLDRLLRDTLAISKAVYQERHLEELDYRRLFRLIFRLLAAKLFADRGHPGDWSQSDPTEVISAVEQFYSLAAVVDPVLNDLSVQSAAWSKIRSAFHLQNISVEALAYVYENTLVDKEMRRQYGTHSTPREVAEYIVQRLPFQELPRDDRRIFEPFAGHAAFLIASMGRLRALLPASMGPVDRHNYFTRMLAGMEIDSFASEVARLSLMLADYPNPDGWRLLEEDVFRSDRLGAELSRARAILCNPPYEDFTTTERSRYTGLRSINKAADILLRTLDKAPDLLGFVLPRTFIDGQSYREIRNKLVATYGSLEIVALPDSAFQHSGMETALLIGHHKGYPLAHLRSAEVAKKDYHNFIQTGRPTREESTTLLPQIGKESTDPPSLWLRPLQRVWQALDGLPRLSAIADIRKGIDYSPSQTPERLVSKHALSGFRPGLARVSDGFEPLLLRGYIYMNMDPQVMYVRAKAYLLPWDRPKVIVNMARLSRGPWVVTGVPDYTGLVLSQLFYAMWPTSGLPLEVLAAIVNGPVANAFMSTNRTSHHNRIETLKGIPIPRLRPEVVATIVASVTEYQRTRQEWLADSPNNANAALHCHQALLNIDAELLTAYDLPPRIERELLDYFAGHRRPGPVEFDRYYPDDFRPAVPLRMFISGELRRASAAQTLLRLPVIHDPVISEVISDLD